MRPQRPDTRRERNLLAAAIQGREADVVRLINTKMNLDATFDWNDADGLGWGVSPGIYGNFRAGTAQLNVHGGTALLWSTAGKHYAVARALVNGGASVNACDTKKRTALHYAVAQGNQQHAEFLLAHGASIDAKNGRKGTALSIAWNHGQVDMVRMLLDNMAEYQEPCGVSLSVERRLTKAERLHGVYPLMTPTAQAARRVRTRIGPQLIDLPRHLRIYEMFLAEPARREALRVSNCEAFAMGHHDRLGAQSRVRWMDVGVIRIVLECL
jgi:hypothetical protein